MPLVMVKDPVTGQMVEMYQPRSAVRPAPQPAPAAPTPKPVAPAPVAPVASAPKPAPAVASAPSGNPLAAFADLPSDLARLGKAVQSGTLPSLDQIGKGVQGGLQNLAKDVSDRGKEPNANIAVARGLTRMAYSGARNTAQELSDVGSEVVAAVQGKPSPTNNFTRDAPFLGIAPPLPKAKSSGGVEDFVTGVLQFGIAFGPATKLVTGGAKLAAKVPGVTKAFGAIDDITAAATTAVKGSKAAQAIAAVPVAGPVAKFAGRALAKGVKDNTITKGAAAGALVDFAVYDQYEGRLTDLIAKVGGPFEVFALDYLKSDPRDEGLTGRLKNVIEGMGVGSVLGFGSELLVQTFKATRAMRAASEASRVADSAKRKELIDIAVKERARLDEDLAQQRNAPTQPPTAPTATDPATPRAPDPRTAVAPVSGQKLDPYQGLDPKERALLEEEDRAALAGQMFRTERAGINYERAITNRPPLPDAAALDPQQRQLDPNLNPQRAQLDPKLDPQQRQVDPQVDPPAAPRQIVPSDDIVLPDSAFRKLTNAKANSAAEAYRKFYNAGQAPENQIELAQALAAVRAKGQRFVSDGVPGLDIDSALRDMQTGRFTPEVEKLRNAYIKAYSDQPMTVLAQTPTAAVDPQLDPQLDPRAVDEGVPPDGGDVPPVRGGEPPMPGDPNFPDSYPAKFIEAFDANAQARRAGDLTDADLLTNTVQKFESPSGKTAYVAEVPETAALAARAFSEVVDRDEIFKSFSNAEIEVLATESLKEEGYSVNLVLKGAERLIDAFKPHRDNLVAVAKLKEMVDTFNVKAGNAASEYLNGAADGSEEFLERVTNMINAATKARDHNKTLINIASKTGALLQSLQIVRANAGQNNFVEGLVDLPNLKNIITRDLQARADLELTNPNSIVRPISEDLFQALEDGNFNPKTLAELDAFAGVMTQAQHTKGFAKSFFAKYDSTTSLAVRGLIMARAAALLSSGGTIMTNIMSNAIRLFQLPVATAIGLGMEGEWTAAGHSLMMFNHYLYNLHNAARLTKESFIAGRSLFDIDASSVDALGKEGAARRLMEESGQTPENIREWDLNTTPWLNIQDKSMWAIAQKRVWQTLNMFTRTQVSLDTFFKTLSGSAFEYTRNLEPGMKRAVEQGLDPNSPAAWEFAQEFARESLQQKTLDLTINGRDILGAVMTGEQAQTAMRYATFTDDIWAEGQMGFKAFGVDIPGYVGRTASVAPAVWQNIIDAAPLAAIIQPFNRTPGDIIKSAMRMTPVTAPFVDTFHRDINSLDKFTKARAKGDMAIGATAITMGLIGMNMGVLQFAGSGPEMDPVAMKKWREDGWIPFSVRILEGTDELGNRQYSRAISIRALEPFTTLFGAMGQYSDIVNSLPKDKKDMLGTGLLFDILKAVSVGQLSKSYYQGFHDFMEVATGIGELGGTEDKATRLEKYLAKLVVSFIPFRSNTNSGRRQVDPAMRVVEPGSEGNFLEPNLQNFPMRFFNQLYNEYKNGVPGLSESLPERLNWVDATPMYSAGIYGEQFLPPEYPWMRYFLQFSPTSAFPVGNEVDPVVREMASLHGKGSEFRGPSANDWGGGQNRLSAAELNRYIKITATMPAPGNGPVLKDALLTLMKSDSYQSLPRQEDYSTSISARASAINLLIEGYKKRGKLEYERQNPEFIARIKEQGDTTRVNAFMSKSGYNPLFPNIR